MAFHVTDAKALTFINGEPGVGIDVKDRGLLYGHGVFETMRVHCQSIPLWHLHLSRLYKGLSVLGIELKEDVLHNQLQEILRRLPEEGLLKLVVTAGIGERGYVLKGSANPNTVFQWSPAPEANGELELEICRYRLPDNPVLAGIKHLNRLDQVLAAMELRDGHQGLLLDGRGYVIEALSHNLFFFRDGCWYTPSLDSCGIAGVMRELLIGEILPALDFPVEVADIVLEELNGMAEVFACNAAMGIQSVGRIKGIGHWKNKEHTEAVQILLEERYPCFSA